MSTLDVELSPELVQLGLALGILRLSDRTDLDSWTFDTAFFDDPAAALRSIMTDDVQRDAALSLAVTMLGRAGRAPDLPASTPGQTWIPLYEQRSAGLYVVVEVTAEGIDVGVAGRGAHTITGAADDSTTVSGSLWLPLVRMSDATGVTLLPGTADGTLHLGVAVDLPPAPPVDPVAIGGASLQMRLPTAGGDPALVLRLRDVRLSAGAPPRDVTLSNGAALAPELVDVLANLLSASVGLDPAASGTAWQLLTLLGLGDSSVPPLDVGAVVRKGPDALREWAVGILSDPTGQRQRAWFTALARLLEISTPVEGDLPDGPLRLCVTPSPDATVCVVLSLASAAGVPSATLGIAAQLDTAAGSLQARVDLATVTATAPLSVRWLPTFVAEAVAGTDDAQAVDTPALRVQSLHVGVASDAAHRLALTLEAHDVDIDGTTHRVLDLTSVEAVTGAASAGAAAALAEALADLLDGQRRRADALLAVLGLLRPVDLSPVDPWPDLVVTAHLLSDPLNAVPRFHAAVLGQGLYATMAEEIRLLLGAEPVAVPGAGSAADPWRVALPGDPAVDGTSSVDLLVWASGAVAAPLLHVGARVTFHPVSVDEHTLEVWTQHELARLALPVPGRDTLDLTFADRHALHVALHEDLHLVSGPLVLQFRRLDAVVWFDGGTGAGGRVTLSGPSLSLDGVPLTLPDPFTIDPATWSPPPATDPLWDSLTALLGSRFAQPGLEEPTLSLRELAAALLGWLPAVRPLRLTLPDGTPLELELPELASPAWPRLSLPDLLADPLRAVREWLQELLTAPGGTDLSPAVVAMVQQLLGGNGPEVDGSGLYDDPWVLPVEAAVTAPRLLAWLDPEGPTLAGLGEVLADLLPDELVDALDDDLVDLPSYGQLLDVLRRAARFDPDLRDVLDGHDDLTRVLEDLRARALAGDGLVPAAAQAQPGDATSPVHVMATHLSAPSHFVASDHIDTDGKSLVYVCAPLPGVAPWPGQAGADAGQVLDLRAPGLPPDAIDLSGVAPSGPWFVLAPTRADAATAAGGLDGHAATVARLRRAVGAIAEATAGAPLTMVAHSVAGHAARELWAAREVEELLTLCTPAASAGLDVLDRLDIGAAVRFLRRLIDRLPPQQQLSPLLDLVELHESTLEDALAGPDGLLRRLPFPLEDFVPPPAPAGSGSSPVTAVVARLTEAAMDTAVAETVRSTAQALLQRLPGRGPSRAAVTHLGLGFEIRPAAFTGTAGITCSTRLRVDLHQVALRPDGEARRVPRVHTRITLRRPGGWLVGGPAPLPGRAMRARVRWAEMLLSADPALTDVQATVVLHDAGLDGLRHGRLVVDGSIDATARALLGSIADALSPLPATGSVVDAVNLLAAVGLAQVDGGRRVTFDTDGFERLIGDPAGWLRTRGADPGLSDRVEGPLRRILGAPASGPLRVPLSPAVRAEVDLGAGTLALVADDLVLGGLLTVTGRLGVDAAGSVRGLVTADPSAATGPQRPLALDVVIDSRDAVPVRLSLRHGSAVIPLHPAAGPAALGRRAALAALDHVTSLALEHARRARPDVTAVLEAAGLLDAHGLARGLVALLADPVGWALHPDALGSATHRGRLSPGRVAALVTAVADLLDARHPDGGLALPRGGSLAAVPDGDDVVVTLTLGQQHPGGEVDAHLQVRTRVDPALVVTTTLDARVRRRSTTGPLGAAELAVAVAREATVTARLRAAGATADVVIPLYPTATGLGQLAEIATQTAVQHVLPVLLDRLAGTTGNDLAAAIGDLGTALRLRASATAPFSVAELRLLAQDPPAELAARFRADPVGVTAALLAVAHAIGGVPSDATGLWVSAQEHVRVALAGTSSGAPQVTLDLRDLNPVDGVVAGATITVSPDGLGDCRLWCRATEPSSGPHILPGAWPFVEARLGQAASGGSDRVEVGVWVDPDGATMRDAILVRVPLGGSPSLLHRRTGPGGTVDSGDLGEVVTEALLEVVAPLALDALLAVEAVQQALTGTMIGTRSLGAVLHDADVLTPGPHRLAPGLVHDLPARAVRAAIAVLEAQLTGVAVGPFLLGLQKTVTSGGVRYGLGMTVQTPLSCPAGELMVTVQPAPPWPELPLQSHHVEVDLVELDTTAQPDLTFTPAIRVAGVGVRVSAQDGPLLDVGVRLDGLGVYAAHRRDSAGFIDGGVLLELHGLGLPLAAAAGGSNPVAAKVLGPGGGTGGDDEPVAPRIDARLVLWRTGAQPLAVALRGGEGSPPWWVPVQRSFGPLYLEQVGVDLEGEPSPHEVTVLVDGGVSLAGLSVGVDDLGLTIPFATAGELTTWRLDLAGLAVAFDGEGVAIAGGLRKVTRPTGVEYAGMLVLRAADFGLAAVGAYGEYPVPNSTERYTSMFVFAALAAPLGGPPAFFVMGVGAGVGLNRRLLPPEDMSQVTSFPLVAAMDPNSTLIKQPMQALVRLGESFPPERGAFWLAAGVRFTSFTVVESIAVLTVAIGDDVEVTLLGLSRAGLPSALTPIAQVELALKARFSAREAVLSVQAQLTANSWLLNPSCRLTGGFAFVIWFRTGEFVLTLGGYHPRFARPAHYPVVPRLGFAWAVSTEVSVKGETYFALTPSCVMAGGRLEASYNAGVVRASFAAGADAIMSWDPFFYEVVAFVTVSAGVRIVVDLGLFGKARVTLSLSVGAQLRLWGPRLRGEAAIDLDVTAITVRFGATDPPTGREPLGWAAFHDKYLVAGDPAGVTMQLAVTSGHFAPGPGGEVSEPDDGSVARPLRVLPEFSLRSTTRTASNRVGTASLAGPPIDLGPMRRVNVAAVHTLRILRVSAQGLSEVTGGTVSPVVGSVPDGVWRVLPEPSTGQGGMRPAFVGADLLATAALSGTTDRVLTDQVETGTHHLPLLDDSDPGGAFSAAMAAADDWAAAQSPAEALAAGQTLMSSPAAALARCLRAAARRGTAARPSDFELRLLPLERAAPPRLQRITAGLVAAPRPPVTVTRRVLPSEPPYQVPEPHPPLVAGILRPDPASGARTRGRTSVGRWAATLPRRHPLGVAGTRAGARPVATDLQLVAPLPDEGHGSLTSQDRGRVFRRVSDGTEARRSLTTGPEVMRALSAVEHAYGGGARLRAGEVHVLHLPGAASDAAERRPLLDVDGDQVVRVVVLDRVGGVLADTAVARGSVELPAGAQRIAVIGTGSGAWPPGGGLAGWHAAAQMLQVADGGYVVPGGVLRLHSPMTRRARRPVDVALVTGADAARGRAVADTVLPIDTRTAVLVLRSAGIDPAARCVLLGLDGAEQETDPVSGALVPPHVVAAGDRLHLVYTLRPWSKGPVTVTVGNEEGWALEGVLGSARPAEAVVRWLLERGVEGTAAGLVRHAETTSVVTWRRSAP